MPQYTITLTAAQDKALKTDIVDLAEWLSAFPAAKANGLMRDIANGEVQRRLAAGEAISGTIDDLVMSAPVQSAAERMAQFANEQLEQAEAGALYVFRTEVQQRLSGSDWTQVSDAPVDQSAWAAYRQILRDLLALESVPDPIDWPTPPQANGGVT